MNSPEDKIGSKDLKSSPYHVFPDDNNEVQCPHCRRKQFFGVTGLQECQNPLCKGRFFIREEYKIIVSGPFSDLSNIAKLVALEHSPGL